MAQLKICSENPQTRNREEAVYDLPDGLASILDRKVDGTGLNCLEQLVDFLCMMLYDTYGKMSSLKEVLQKYGYNIEQTQQVSIWRLHDGTPLYDLSPEQAGGVRYTNLYNEPHHGHFQDFITISAQRAAARVFRCEINRVQFNFGHDYGTKYLIIQAVGDQNMFHLTEEMLNGTVHMWRIDADREQRHVAEEYVHIATPVNMGTVQRDQQAVEAYFDRQLRRWSSVTKDQSRVDIKPNLPRLYDATLAGKVVIDDQRMLTINGRHILYGSGGRLPYAPGDVTGIITVSDLQWRGRQGYRVRESAVKLDLFVDPERKKMHALVDPSARIDPQTHQGIGIFEECFEAEEFRPWE